MMRIGIVLVSMVGTWGLSRWLPEVFHTAVVHLAGYGITMSHILVLVVGGVAYKLTH